MTDVARGRYIIVIETDGGWTQLKDQQKFDDVLRIPVMPGEETYLGEILFVSGTE